MPSRNRTCTGSAGRSAWQRARSCATTRSFSGTTARRLRSRARSEIPLRGEHNVENVLAACAAAYLAGATPAAIASGVKTFRGVEHRLEFVGEIGGVQVLQRFKATNVDAALKAIEAFPGPLIVILGGKDKGSPYTPLREPLRARARVAILIGAAAEKIARGSGRRCAVRACGNARARRSRLRRNARSRATWCCSRRRARASTSSKITSIAAAHSSSSSRKLENAVGANYPATHKG